MMGQNHNLNSLTQYDSVRFHAKIFDDDDDGKRSNSIVLYRFIKLVCLSLICITHLTTEEKHTIRFAY